MIFDNLISSFGGKVFGVNPNAEIVLGEKIYRNILDIKSKIDLAIICVPQKIVPNVLEGCGKKGVKYAIVISSGFSETGPIGKSKEEEILEIAKKHKMRILGPNCLGLINNFKNLNASFAPSRMPPKYRVGIFSQSGAMGAAMLDFARGGGFGFSYFVSLGNKADISEIDLIESWADDENVNLAVGYLEDVKDGKKFIEVSRNFTSKKPLILLKGGMSDAGNRAASLHTAAMVQDKNVFEAACKEAGIILAKNLSDMFELAVSFAENPVPVSNRLAIVSNAGGPGVVAADSCVFEGVQLPSLSPKTIAEISKETSAVSVENPIDLRGDASDADFGLALKAVLADKNIDGALVIISPQRMTEVDEIAWQVVRAKENSKKPVYVNFLGGEVVASARDICRQNGVPSFTYPERAIRAFRFQSERKKIDPKRKQSLKKHPRHRLVKSLLNFSGKKVSYPVLSKILSSYGIPMAEVALARNEEEAVKFSRKIPYPVAMKISSPDILHKTDVGGVVLGIKNDDEARHAYQKIIANVKKNKPQAKIDGVVVMEMASEGLELITGFKRDPIFGPVLMFGFGGIFVELIEDFSLVLAPFDRSKVRELINSTKASKIIKGYRGQGYDSRKIEDALLGLGRLAIEHPEIESLEINPIIIEENGDTLGLDARIKLNSD